MPILSHKIKLYPTPDQEQMFIKACGVARFAYNWALHQWQEQYKAAIQTNIKPSISEQNLRKQLNAIKAIEFPWMLETPKGVPQTAIINLGDAYKRFFTKKGGYPKLKKKGKHDSFRADNAAPQLVAFSNKYVKLPVLGNIKMAEKLRFNGKLISVTIAKTADMWFASFNVTNIDNIETKTMHSKNQAIIGVDLGITHLASLSNGEQFEAPKPFKKAMKRLAKAQRKFARKQKGSNRRKKAAIKVARIYYRMSCIRQDSLHKLTTDLVNRFDVIAIEDLNVKGMLKNHKLARAIADIGFGEFRRQLTYKAGNKGSQIVVVDGFYPSSKLCSDCGYKADKMDLAIRSWECPKCNAVHDRDINAARNLERRITA